MTEYKVSVIIPVYNAQNTLNVAINSVINQTICFDNIELILVDDKSSDNSREIITSYSNKYNNIKAIFLKENTGSPSKPRNIGIDNATSQYLIFLDNDDELLLDYCETLYNIIKRENNDIVYCQNATKFLNEVYVKSENSKETCLVKNPLSLRFTMWGVCFRREFIKKHDIKCPPTLYEDGVFAIKAFTQADRIIELPNYYGYIYTVEKKKDASITHNISKEIFNNFLKGFCIVRDFLNENNLSTKQLWINHLPLLLFMFLKLDVDKEDKTHLLKKYREFELSLNYPDIKLNSKPLDMLNKAIINENYDKAILMSQIASKIYNNRKLKNFIFKHMHGLKKVDVEKQVLKELFHINGE